MANKVIQLKDGSDNLFPQTSPVITGTSTFANMTAVPQYPRSVMETIRTDIVSYSNGIYNISTGTGPIYFAHIGKYNNNYWSALIHTYAATDSNIYFAFYANGDCRARIISY